MKTIGIGIIGWGFMGRTHTLAIRSLPLFYPDAGFTAKLVGVCSRTVSKAEKAKEALGFEYATGDYHALLADPRIDVVSVSTPNDQHEAMVIDALKAGKHVYVDKPLTVDYPSAQRILAAAQGAPGKAQLALHNRFFTATMRARQIIEEGKLGDILTFTCRYLHSGSIDPAKPMGWKQGAGGGVLLDLGSHALDLVTWLIGQQPKEVLCAENTLYPQRPTREGGLCRDIAEDHALMLLRLKNGALGTVEASKITAGTTDVMFLEITGTKGAIRWNLEDPGWLEFYDNTQPEMDLGGLRGYTRIECVGRYPAPGGAFLPSKNAVGWERAHLHCYFSFLDCVARDKAPSPSLAEGARLQRLMDCMAASAEKHGWVSVE
ncbi:MAG: Gfo/Idh/MocA family oxidoreductase [Clostridia bacterium]|nr:Gfo/Idh/MocA family oxidoreductase [Clostridia bacterium]